MIGKDAIIFSSYVPKKERLWIAKFFLDCFVENFSDCDVYVGVNEGSCQEWLDTLEEYKAKLHLKWMEVPLYRTIDSDAAGYQAALDLLWGYQEKYKTILFAHTKGITHPYSDEKIKIDLNGLKQTFFTKEVRERVERKFTNKRIGLFSDCVTKTTDPTLENLDKVFNFYYSGNKLMILASIYYMKGFLVHQFLHNCKKEFFTQNLEALGFDRYFFERDFPTLCTRFGYEFEVNRYISHPEWNTFNKEQFIDIVLDWRKENNLL